MVLLWAARYGVRVPFLARFSLGLGIAATLTTNLLHGLSGGPIAMAIAAWPAVALTISYELLTWVIRAGRVQQEAPPELATPVSVDSEPVVEVVHEPKHRKRQPVPPPQQAAPVNPKPPLDEERMERARKALAENPKLSGAALGRLIGTSDRHGSRLRKAVLAESAH
jgi:hypothetical protein